MEIVEGHSADQREIIRLGNAIEDDPRFGPRSEEVIGAGPLTRNFLSALEALAAGYIQAERLRIVNGINDRLAEVNARLAEVEPRDGALKSFVEGYRLALTDLLDNLEVKDV